LTCGMAIPFPIPVAPDCSREISISFKEARSIWPGSGKEFKTSPKISSRRLPLIPK